MLKNVIFTYFATAKVVLSYCTELLSILIINSQSDSKSNSISYTKSNPSSDLNTN